MILFFFSKSKTLKLFFNQLVKLKNYLHALFQAFINKFHTFYSKIFFLKEYFTLKCLHPAEIFHCHPFTEHFKQMSSSSASYSQSSLVPQQASLSSLPTSSRSWISSLFDFFWDQVSLFRLANVSGSFTCHRHCHHIIFFYFAVLIFFFFNFV